MAVDRFGVRLDRERRRMIEEVAEGRVTSIPSVIRDMIDRVYEEEVMRPRRLAAAERLGAREIEDVPDPETLSKQLDETYAIPDLY